MVAAFWVGAGGSAAGMVLAAVGRRPGFGTFFLFFLLAALAGAFLDHYGSPRPKPPEAPRTYVCQEHSGSDNRCPGD